MKSVKEIRQKTGKTQAAFAEAYGIPLRTLQSWETGEREPAPYIVEMLQRLTDLDKTPVYAWYMVGTSEGNDGIMTRLEGIQDEIDAKNKVQVYWDKMSTRDQAQYTDGNGAFYAGLYRIEWDENSDSWEPAIGDPARTIIIAE